MSYCQECIDLEKENEKLKLELKHSNIILSYCMSKITNISFLNYIQILYRKRDKEIKEIGL